MKKFKKIILCTCLSIALLSAYGCSSSQDSTNKTTEASMTDATKSDVTDNTSEEVAEDTEKVSEEAVSEDTAEDTSEATTETVAKGDDKKAEATTEGRAESKTENTPATTQTAPYIEHKDNYIAGNNSEDRETETVYGRSEQRIFRKNTKHGKQIKSLYHIRSCGKICSEKTDTNGEKTHSG